MQILKVIFILLEVLVLFNLLIFVHELGHFLAARWRGLKVERFAIWFGKPIWQKEINGIVYCLGSIPAGGYVALPQMASMDVIEGKTDSKQEQLPPISALDKIIVAFAGPLFSFGLALTFATIIWGVGRPVSETETTTTIGYVFTNSPAEAAGLKAGDRLTSIDGKPVTRFSGIGDTINWRIVRSESETIPITFIRDNETKTVTAKPTREKTKGYERKALKEIQILPKQTAIIATVEAGMPGAQAKLKPNDIILAVNGSKIYHPEAVVEAMRNNPGQPLILRIKRDSEELDVSVTPVMAKLPPSMAEGSKDKMIPRIGIGWERSGVMDVDHPNPIKQIKMSIDAMAGTLGAIVSRKSDIGLQHLSGPVGIGRIYYQLFKSEQGWRLALWFSVILNVNLGLLNLLPIPVLDGGHITLALIEGVRRKPVSHKILNVIQTSCAVLIIGYMLFVTFFDAQDWLPFRSSAKPPTEQKAAPEPAPAKP